MRNVRNIRLNIKNDYLSGYKGTRYKEHGYQKEANTDLITY